MRHRILTAATLSGALLAALPAAAQPYPQQQPYPPQPGAAQPYPGQPAPGPQYPAQPYAQQQPYPGQPAPAQPYPGQAYPPPPGYAQPYPGAYTAPAPSQPPSGNFGSQGQFILSADRLFGLSLWSIKQEGNNNQSITNSGTDISLLWGGSSDIPYTIPRAGLDFTVAQNISIGGSIGFSSRSSKAEFNNGSTTTSQDGPTQTAFAFAPRFGYILGINSTIALWFRGGITYFNVKSESKSTGTASTTTSTNTVNGFALNLEPQLVVTPVQHFGFTLGPVVDIPFSGNVKQESSGATNGSQDFGYKITNFGIAFGLVGYL